MQAYSDPKRENEATALPDIEVWQHTTFEGDESNHPADNGPDCDGWYWQACFPGCLPDSDPSGPFETEAEALADAREGLED